MKSTYCKYILEKILSTSELGPILALIAPSPLENVVFETTNFTTETGICIDLCITNRKKLINSVDVLTPVCSTHVPVLAEISFKSFKQHSFKRQIRNYNAADIEGLADELNITNWDDLVFNSDNINDVYSNFLKILDDAVKKYIPTRGGSRICG